MSDSAAEPALVRSRRPWRRWLPRVWWRRYLVYVAIVMAGLAAVYAYFDIRGRLRWNAHVAEIEAAGGSLDLEKLIPGTAAEVSFWNDPVWNEASDPESSKYWRGRIVFDYESKLNPRGARWRFVRETTFLTDAGDATRAQAAKERLLSFGREDPICFEFIDALNR
ncbi:MAG: hypothetical protein KDM64_17990, partial [Verrucomicrobiae bacterium]|nr:hypothetical protein [Verrucomicrobiae bacterium]